MDLVQTAILNFLRWGPRFVPKSGAQLQALLKRIAMNELIDQRRRISGAGEHRHLDSFADSKGPLSGFGGAGSSSERPSRIAERSEDDQWVRLALQFLPEDERYLLIASEVEGQEWSTIAAELGLESSDTARMRCTRLKPKVANLLRRLRIGQLPEDS